MVIKVYSASITGNTEVRKHIQRVLLILQGYGIKHEEIDICEPERKSDRDYMQANSEITPGYSVALPPQIFNDENYCGGYETFDEAVESDTLSNFLQLPDDQLGRLSSSKKVQEPESALTNGVSGEEEHKEETENGDGEGTETAAEGEEEIEADNVEGDESKQDGDGGEENADAEEGVADDQEAVDGAEGENGGEGADSAVATGDTEDADAGEGTGEDTTGVDGDGGTTDLVDDAPAADDEEELDTEDVNAEADAAGETTVEPTSAENPDGETTDPAAADTGPAADDEEELETEDV